MKDTERSGTTRGVVVFGSGPGSKAAVVTLTAVARPQTRFGRVKFHGSLRLDRSTVKHVRTVVYPLVEAICRDLGMEAGCFVINGTNLSAASTMGVGVDISGFSADLPLALAMLSARLQFELPSDTVFTGHIASPRGEVRQVRQIPAKLAAAMLDPTVDRFVCPALDADSSLQNLAVSDANEIRRAIDASHDRIRIHGIRDIAEALSVILEEADLVHAALRAGHFGKRFKKVASESPTTSASRHIGRGMRRRFFALIERSFQTGDTAEAKDLLHEFVSLHITRNRYPSGFGSRLYRLLQALPPHVRRRIIHPIISVDLCAGLSTLIGKADEHDLLELYCTMVRGLHPGEALPEAVQEIRTRVPNGPNLFRIVISEIAPDNLTRTIGLPIDAARGCFTVASPIVHDHQELLDLTTVFYRHVLCHTGRSNGTGTRADIAPESLALLERTFARHGGLAEARAQAMTGIHGGMINVLNMITDQYKLERQNEYANHVLALAIDPADWPARVNFIKQLLAAYPGIIPPELSNEPVERFARGYGDIARALVNSMSEVKQVLRRM